MGSCDEDIDASESLGRPENFGKALDFGCGAGRLTRALSPRFVECVGLDISENMLEIARRLNADRENCCFQLNTRGDLSCFADGEFDLVVSDIVLQHMPSTNLIKSYISEFLRVLHPGGLAIFQLPSHIGLLRRMQWRRRLYRAMRSVGVSEHLLYERLGLVPMAMRSLPEA